MWIKRSFKKRLWRFPTGPFSFLTLDLRRRLPAHLLMAANWTGHAKCSLKANPFPQCWYKFLCWWGPYWLRAAIAPPGSILNRGLGRFMGFSRRFIFALMPLCSAAYWCFCHIVKIYGAISLSRNGLIQVSGPGRSMAQYGSGRKTQEDGAVNS